VTLDISITGDALDWLRGREGRELVIDLAYKKGRCTSAFCRTVPSIEVYLGERRGRYDFEEVTTPEGRVVHVAKPLLEAASKRDVKAVIERGMFRGLRLRGIDPYELGL
jgi:hypothetical protein